MLVPSDNPATIASTASIGNTTASAAAVYGSFGTTWTLTNQGLVSDTASDGVGINLANAGTITNFGSGIIQGNTTSGGGLGIYLQAGGYVANHSGGTISGYDGISANAAATVVNGGTILANQYKYGGGGSGAKGIILTAGGSVTTNIPTLYMTSGGVAHVWWTKVAADAFGSALE